MTETPDAAVIGGGLIGCSIAFELARRGATVTVIERDQPCRGASWAAAGMLSAVPESRDPPAFHALVAAAFRAYPEFIDELRAASGIDPEYEACGRIHVATDARAAAALPELLERGAPSRASSLTPAATVALEPLLAPGLHGAVRIECEARVDNRKLGSAVVAAAASLGVEFRLGQAAIELCHHEGRCGAVRLADGEMIDAAAIVLANGAWAAQLEGLPRDIPVRPARGQMLAVAAAQQPGRAHRPDPRPSIASGTGLRHTITSDDVYLVPRRDGRVLIGATVEDAGFAAGPTPAGLVSLLVPALRIVPALAGLPITETWAGFRPTTPDGVPTIGADPDSPGVYYALGHFRNGILLAPFTAQIIADVLAGAEPGIDIEPFSVTRFESETLEAGVAGRAEHERTVRHGMRAATEPAPGSVHRTDSSAGLRRMAERAGHVVDRADYDPAFDPGAPIRCERCSGEMEYTSSCKIICRTCGMMRDCEDP